MFDSSLARATTGLFVPGDRPDRFAKAAASNADVVIIDLEDAVGVGLKAEARENAVSALSIGDRENAGDNTFGAAVRINAVVEGGLVDIEALARLSMSDGSRLRGVMVPKAEREHDIAAIREALGPDIAIVPLIETVKGLRDISRLALAPGVVRFAFGALDFAVDADATSQTLLDQVRCEIVLASRAAGLAAPFESPNPEFRDLAGVGKLARSSRALGFGGQLCIHPAQVAVVEAAFRPTDAEIEWATQVMAFAREGATQVDGAMIDRPVVLRAERVLTQARLS